ncbi:sporulation protein [Streptomyces sp. RKND-216]|uniref:sporulation protein n=1 Tax=Streptomyces sp. RKND-216 TaxID=2562581 RepID=UPI00109DB95E|nr:sporulation protein [Streptomyces sp. RKND-216]THA25362.1 sporulation protein [Streptomyces sp. RKND-216]
MVFKKLLGSLGIGGPTVDTVIDPDPALPGGTLSGQVHLRGGDTEFDIDHVTLELVARVEAEHEDGETEGVLAFERFTVAGGFRLSKGELRSIPFSVTLPWEAPVTELHGQSLGIALGVRTELAVDGARDSSDLDPLTVRPLPAQEAVLEALGQLGFGFKSADLECGHINGTGQQLPFYQEIELTSAPQYAHALHELEVTFLSGPGGVEVVLEADKPAGFFSSGHDVVNRYVVDHDTVPQRDWNTEVDSWIRQMLDHHGTGAHGNPLSGGASHHGDHHHHGGHHGPGMGTAVAAGAVGVAGGLVAAEVVDEVGDFFEGDEEEGDED